MVEPRVIRSQEWASNTFCGFVMDVAGYDIGGPELSLHDCAVADEKPLPERDCVSFLIVCYVPLPMEQVVNELLRAIKVAQSTRNG